MNTKPMVTRSGSRSLDDSSSPEGHPGGDRYTAVEQYSLRRILGAWAATAVPMGVLLWLVAPWLSDRLAGPDPFIQALLICFAVGLVWQIALLLILLGREQGGLHASRIVDGLWLRAPKDPRSGRTGGRVWWWVLPFVVLSGVVNAGWIDPVGPLPRDLPKTLELARGRVEHYFHGNWSAFTLFAFVVLLAPIGEELFFRGLLLPRMRKVFGRADVVVNGALFGVYHLHQPWSIPASVIDGIVSQAYPTRRFQSIWIAIAAHTVPSFVIIGAVVPLVL
jgi:uncharacterized protein